MTKLKAAKVKNFSETEQKRPVLMIDDDIKLCRLVRDYLAPFGFHVGVAYNGLEGLDKIRAEEFQAVILDVMLPGMDGFTVLKQIRQFSNVPVLMLTALGDESDRIVGLEIGADDYLPKTFSTRELLARLRAVTRRAEMLPKARRPEAEEITVGAIAINPATRETRVAGEHVTLTALEFDLLLSLMRSAGRVLDRDTLLDAVAGRSYDVFDRSIDVHISSLRRKIGDDSKSPRYIKTIRSVGYMLVNESDDAEGGDAS